MLSSYSPEQRIREGHRNRLALQERLSRAMNQEITLKHNRFQSSVRMLKALNPLNVMERGYSIVYQNGEVANSVHAMEIGENIQIQLQDGTVDAKVETMTMR